MMQFHYPAFNLNLLSISKYFPGYWIESCCLFPVLICRAEHKTHSDENGRGSRRLGMSPTCLELLWRGTCWELQSAHNAKGVMASKNLAWHSPPMSDSICGVVLCCWSYLRVEFESADSQVHPREALISSNGVNLYKLVLPYGWAHRSVWLVIVQIESFL